MEHPEMEQFGPFHSIIVSVEIVAYVLLWYFSKEFVLFDLLLLNSNSTYIKIWEKMVVSTRTKIVFVN